MIRCNKYSKAKGDKNLLGHLYCTAQLFKNRHYSESFKLWDLFSNKEFEPCLTQVDYVEEMMVQVPCQVL